MSEDNKTSAASPTVPITGSIPSGSGTHLPDPSLPAPNLGEDEVGFTAADLIAQQSRLEAQANEAIPFQFDTCTHERGYIRQPVYACKTCGGGGVCAGCSVSCHAEHELVELFNKRKFRCDCGTPNLYRQHEPNRALQCTRITEQLVYPEGAQPCSLRKPGYSPQNDANAYNHNFDGEFCYCERGKTYDPEKEDETMFQCIVCEEWLHESCTALRPVSLQDSSSSIQASQTSNGSAASADRLAKDGEAPLIDHDLFDLMICDACVRKPNNEILRRYAGAKGWMVLAPSQDVSNVKEHDSIAKIQVPTQEELREAGGQYHNGSSWQIFGLAVEPDRTLTQTEVSAATDGALLSSVAELARSTVVTASEMVQGYSTAGDCATAKREDESQPASLSSASGIAERREGKRRADDGPNDQDTGESETKRVKQEHEASSKAQRVPSASSSGLIGAVQKEAACMLPEPLSVVESLPESNVNEWTPALSEATTAAAAAAAASSQQHRYDIFLSEDFRDRICRCTDCLARWAHLPHVLDAEETYAPPSDPQASVRDDDAASITSSTYDLGMAALRSMPREKMINSLHAYSKFRDALWEHLKPFAGTGKMVREEDVRAFFQKKLNTER
ncbi:hypothetical protein EX895_005544 [Sporisorium graminicola]|uniref:UBR-type domain-containing protein n=1 Tax=Sporisorium graminicola TaxID=280036 RepID=A0A4U7KQW4_9BASI|nr:hypothetical protein EX895_005544 [Sporisorium graminicola]TKY85382.1 hypothetical protein EX895_005544 [Sporisorium graminicola]